jgi:hypothetical protein
MAAVRINQARILLLGADHSNSASGFCTPATPRPARTQSCSPRRLLV